MDKKILIGIDGSINANDAIDYATRMGDRIHDLHFSLMAIQPALSQYLEEEAKTKATARIALEKAIAANKSKAEEILDQAKERMVRKGLADNRIEQLTKVRDAGVAKDLLVSGEAKPYDAILVGRRGASYLREWVMGSVTASLIDHSKTIPLWVVDGSVESTDVLLAADGSTASLRALDHMAFILAADPGRKLHLLHVRPRFQDYCEIDTTSDDASIVEEAILSSDQKCMDDFQPQSLAALERYNINADQLNTVYLDGRLSISRSVIQYASDHQFGTVVVGRHGTGKNPFTGSVSRSILNKAKDIALWVVP